MTNKNIYEYLGFTTVITFLTLNFVGGIMFFISTATGMNVNKFMTTLWIFQVITGILLIILLSFSFGLYLWSKFFNSENEYVG